MRFRHIAFAAAAAVALAGCGEDAPDAEPHDPFTVSVSPQPSDDPTAEESETFDPAKETARQFIKRWMVVDAEMQVTGDAAAFRELYDDSCTSCERQVADIETIHEAGGYVKVEPSRIVDMTRDTKNQWTVRFHGKGTEYRRGEDEPVEYLEGGEYVLTVYLYRDDAGAWRLINYTRKA